MAENEGRELAWDDEIEDDGPSFTIVPEGDYEFEVMKMERARHNGSANLPPCNKAVVHIKITGEGGETTIKHNLFLHTKTEGLLCAFFRGIGQRKHGEKIAMNWNRVVGSTGRAKVGIRKWTNDDGKEMEFNEIVEFYDPEDKPQGGFTPGRF